MTKQPAATGLTWGDPLRRIRPKLEQLILYLADRCQGDNTFGATKLNKILFFSDFTAFAHWGNSITGAQYMRLQQGPVPKHLVPVRDRMVKQGKLAMKAEQRYGFGSHVQHRPIALVDADLSEFSSDEIALVDRVVNSFWGKSAREISELSHGRIWRVAGEDKAPIPYEAVFVSDREPTRAEIDRTKELAEELGWDEAA